MANKVAMSSKLYHYRATVTNVVDGDTIDLSIDLGFDIVYALRVRLYGIDTPEKVGATKIAGLAATDFAKKAVSGKAVTIATFEDKQEKFGRFLANVYYEKSGLEVCLNDELVAAGHAVKYFGGKKA